MAGLTFANGRLVFNASPALDFSTGAGTIALMCKTTAADNTWQAHISGETSSSPAAASSRWSLARAAGTGTGGAGNPVPNSIAYSKATATDQVWTGETSVGPPANSNLALKWLAADGDSFIWFTKPAAGSSIGFVKIFTLSGTTWTEKALSPQNMTFQIGDGTALGVGGVIVIGKYENSDPFAGNIHLVLATTTPHTAGAINTFMTTKTTAAVIAASAANSFLTDASNGLATDLIGGRTLSASSGVSAASALAGGAWTFGTGAAASGTGAQLLTVGVG